MLTVIINDCRDENAFGKQETLIHSLFDTHISTIGIDFGNTIEAAGNLIDVLGVAEYTPDIVLVNAAPRHKGDKSWPNGTPFSYFKYQSSIVISTVDEYTLSLVKKLELTKEIQLLDVPTVVDWAVTERFINLDEDLGERIKVSQFRSCDFSPRAAHWIEGGLAVPSKDYPMSNIMDAPSAIWHVDNFGNCKTTLLPHEINFEPGKTLTLRGIKFECAEYLKDAPKHELAIVQGSSGIGDKKFLEIVIKGGNAALDLGVKAGDLI